MPYWDWTNSQTCDPCIDDLIGAPTEEVDEATRGCFVSPKSPFGTSRWKVFCSNKTNYDNVCSPCQIDRKRPNRLSRTFYRTNFPTVEEVIEFLSLTAYHNFKDKCLAAESMLESGEPCTCKWKPTHVMLHATIHLFLHGTMDPLSSSIYDPLFLLHHAQVDRLFERWRRGVLPTRNDFVNLGKEPPQCRECYMGALLPPVKYRDVFVDTRELGYTYENLNFGSLSEEVKIARWNTPNYHKACPKYKNRRMPTA